MMRDKTLKARMMLDFPIIQKTNKIIILHLILKMMKTILLFLILSFGSICLAQNIRLRAKFYETKIGGIKNQEESNKLLTFDLDKMNLTIYGNPSERFDFYESFEIDEKTFMFPSLDSKGLEFAIEYYIGEDYVYITIQNATENMDGSFDSRMYVCEVLD